MAARTAGRTDVGRHRTRLSSTVVDDHLPGLVGPWRPVVTPQGNAGRPGAPQSLPAPNANPDSATPDTHRGALADGFAAMGVGLALTGLTTWPLHRHRRGFLPPGERAYTATDGPLGAPMACGAGVGSPGRPAAWATRGGRRIGAGAGAGARTGVPRPRGDRGAGTTEMVIVTPLLLLLLTCTVQVALWMHAVHIAQTSAAQALSAARAEGGNTAAGRAQADTVLAQLGTGVLIDPRVTLTRTADRVSAEVSGTAQMLIPGVRLPVHVTAAGPIDAWTTDVRGLGIIDVPGESNVRLTAVVPS